MGLLARWRARRAERFNAAIAADARADDAEDAELARERLLRNAHRTDVRDYLRDNDGHWRRVGGWR